MDSLRKDSARYSPEMLFQSVIPPPLLSSLPADAIPQRLFCNIWLGILCGLVENGTIVLPHNHATEVDILNAIGTWPPKYRKRAQELFVALKLKKRLVASPTAYTPSATCGVVLCQPYTGACSANPESYYFSSDVCSACPTILPFGARVVEPIDFFISDFSRVRSAKTAFVLSDGQWKAPDFEREILVPIFRTAKNVKIYDRYIGRSIVKRGHGVVGLNDNYKRSLEWIVTVFRNLGGSARGGVFEIYCGVDRLAVPAKKRPQVRAELATFQATLQALLGGSVQIIVKEETKGAQCPHGRYLITDQVAVLIERGFDLLWDDAGMNSAGLNPLTSPRPIRDVAVVLCEDCAAVESHTKLLPNY